MSAQRLNARSIRRIERDTGLELWMAWSHGGYTMNFCTTDHRHGWWDKKTSTWGFDEHPMHYSTCAERFPS